jgi:enoyl-CoA hydratase/carnithine racemase
MYPVDGSKQGSASFDSRQREVMRMDFETLRFELDGGIGLLTLNRPERLNAIDAVMLDELNVFWRKMLDMYDCRVIVMTGAGDRGFCSGLDLKEAANLQGGFASGGLSGDTLQSGQKKFSDIIEMMRACPQPIIAAMNGAAMGAGLSFAMAADVRLASPAAKYCASYINIGTGGADMGSSYFLWRLVGWGMAAEMLLTGRVIEIDEAYRIGLANHVYPPEELLDRAMEMAQRMAEKPPLALRMTKDALNIGLNSGNLRDSLRLEDRNQVLLIESLYIAGAALAAAPPESQKKDIGKD